MTLFAHHHTASFSASLYIDARVIDGQLRRRYGKVGHPVVAPDALLRREVLGSVEIPNLFFFNSLVCTCKMPGMLLLLVERVFSIHNVTHALPERRIVSLVRRINKTGKSFLKSLKSTTKQAPRRRFLKKKTRCRQRTPSQHRHKNAHNFHLHEPQHHELCYYTRQKTSVTTTGLPHQNMPRKKHQSQLARGHERNRRSRREHMEPSTIQKRAAASGGRNNLPFTHNTNNSRLAIPPQH